MVTQSKSVMRCLNSSDLLSAQTTNELNRTSLNPNLSIIVTCSLKLLEALLSQTMKHFTVPDCKQVLLCSNSSNMSPQR